jgi:hypothetical protein
LRNARWRARLGDTAPAIADTIREAPTGTQFVGDPIDLTDAAVAVVIRRWPDQFTVATGPATIVSEAEGTVTVDLPPAVTAVAALYEVVWVVTFDDGTIRTFPGAVEAPALIDVVGWLDGPGPDPCLLATLTHRGAARYLAGDLDVDDLELALLTATPALGDALAWVDTGDIAGELDVADVPAYARQALGTATITTDTDAALVTASWAALDFGALETPATPGTLITAAAAVDPNTSDVIFVVSAAEALSPADGTAFSVAGVAVVADTDGIRPALVALDAT